MNGHAEGKGGAQSTRLAGIIYGIAAFTSWGFLPLYWKLLNNISPEEILAHRILWSFVFFMLILFFNKSLGKLRPILTDGKKLFYVFLCALFITVNWGTYIWAVNSGHIVESSMGYYMNPLIAVLLGVTVLKEKLNALQAVALGLAATGVLILTFQYGKFPWVSITLAVSFALYGLFKKLVNLDSAVGLAIETLILMPFTLGLLIFRQAGGTAALGHVSAGTVALLLCSGVATATPLLWFAEGAKRVELSTIGFTQYISPTIMLVLGILVYKEQFTGAHFISFGFIWAAVVVFSISQVRAMRSMRKDEQELAVKQSC